MEFVDLKAQYKELKNNIDTRMARVLEHGQFIMGPEVFELEERLQEFVGARYAISCANGTDALLMALMAIDIKAGDEIIVPDFSFYATAEVIFLLGAVPVFVDVDAETFNIDVQKIKAAISEKTKAIIPVSLYGMPADFGKINALAKEHNLIVIEDAAQSFGGTYQGKKSGNLSTIACTSFFPAKPLGCYGDGGACFTSDENIAKQLRQIRLHGSEQRYHHIRLGINGRIDTLQAAILLAKLEAYPREFEQRNKIAAYYFEHLPRSVQKPRIPAGFESAWAQYTVRLENRDEWAQNLKALGIPTSIHYPIPMSRQLASQKMTHRTFENPVSLALSKSVLSIPLHPYLTKNDQEQITKAFLKTK